jgi:hypothetical protein
MKKILMILCVGIVFFPSLGHAQTCGSVNIAGGKSVTVSSEVQFHEGSTAVDNNVNTWWSTTSGSGDAHYIYVDLGQSYSICRIVAKWSGNGRAKNYTVQTSTDATNWTTIHTRSNNTNNDDDFTVGGTGRYIKLDLTERTNSWSGYELAELRIYNSLAGNTKPSVSLTAPANNATYYAGTNINLAATASDPDGSVTKVEFYQGTTKIGESTTSPYTFTWTNVQPGTYSLTAKATDNDNADSITAAISITVNPTNRWSIQGNSGTSPDSNFVGTLDNKRLVFRTNNTEKMTILSNGFVGIGTATAPSDTATKLAVKGTIRAIKLKVTQTGWADYVFEKDYKLMSLTELEAYIKKHQHLPGIPTTATVEKNGTDVAEIQATLLKKIEELTLYIIEQQKQIEELKKQMKK